MAFNPSTSKVQPPVLYVASWGPNQWVTHEYEDENNRKVLPLVFTYMQQKKYRHEDGNKTVCHAYHFKDGSKHGFESLVRDETVVAKYWNVKTMLKVILDLLTKDNKNIEEYEVYCGEMSDERNSAYAKFSNGSVIGVHIKRPDIEPGKLYEPISYSFIDMERKVHSLYPADQKKAFFKDCKEGLSKIKQEG